jgi:hypothetical protein
MKIIITESQYNTIINEGFDFDSVYKSLYPKMLNQICLSYANGDRDKADEYCQLGFIKVYQKMGLNKKSPKMKDVDFEILDVLDDSPEEPLYSSSDIKNAMETLPPSYRKVFELYYFDNMSHLEIADELGISDGTSKSNLFKAKAKIKSFLEDLNKKREDFSSL